MRTKEFINKVKELGYDIDISMEDVIIKQNGCIFVIISRRSAYTMSSYTVFGAKHADELLDLCVDYVKTPIEEREEEKKYCLRLKDDFYKITYAYLTRDIRNGDYFSFGKHELKGTQNKFTQKEIDEIKKKFNTDLEEFRQIEVED